MRKAFGLASLAVLTVAMLGGCTSPNLVSQGRGTAAPSATKQRAQPRAVVYPPCTAADLTGSLGILGVGTGRISQAVIFTNRGDQPCALAGGPTEITGIRRDGHRVSLVTGASRAAGQLYGPAGPVKLLPGQSAQAVITTTDMCSAATSGGTDNFVAFDIGIARSGAVRISFPPGQRYNAVCGIYVSTFGVPAHNLGACKAAQLGAALEGSSEPGTSGTALGTLYVWDESGRACTLTGPVTVTGLDHAGRTVTTRARFTIAPGSPPLSPDGSAPGKHGRTPAQEVAATLLLIGNPTLACRAHPTDPVAWRITLASGGSTTAPNAGAASGPALTRRGGLTTCGNRLAGQSPILIAPS